MCRLVDDGGHGAADVDRTDDEAEVVVGAHRAVGAERAALSAAGASEACHFGIEVEVRSRALGQLIRMCRYGKFLLAPGEGRG